jgi:hypothetical protein
VGTIGKRREVAITLTSMEPLLTFHVPRLPLGRNLEKLGSLSEAPRNSGATVFNTWRGKSVLGVYPVVRHGPPGPTHGPPGPTIVGQLSLRLDEEVHRYAAKHNDEDDEC